MKLSDIFTNVRGTWAEVFEDARHKARAAQGLWAARPFAERRPVFTELRRVLSRRSREVADVIAAENGKTALEALTQEIIPILDSLVFLEKRAQKTLAPRRVRLKTRQFYFRGKACEVRREPWGVVGVLGTWNYAFFISLSQILFAAAAGNAVIFKGAPESPKVTRLIEELLEEAGFPRDLVFCASGPAEAGEALTQAGCDKYILTGSRSTGRKVLAAAAQDLKPAVAELSGADAFVILGDADWKLAVRTLLWAAFQYSGQTCVAPRRVYVLEKDREKFLAVFERAASDLAEFIRAQGKLRTEERAREERAKIERAVKRGAKLLWQAEGGAEGGSAFAPRVYRGLPADEDADFMAPVFFLQECGTEKEILDALEAGRFGLGASVWTADRAKARVFADAIRAGQVWVNDSIFSVALGEAPFGGAKQSGFGRTRGEEGLLEMTQAKFVSFDWRARRSTRYLPPYRPDSFVILDGLQKILFHPDWKMKWQGLSVILRTAQGGPKDLGRDSSAPAAPQNDVK